MIFDRDRQLALEDQFLASYATKSKYSKGREHSENEDSMRTAFQKDRDRIIHSRAFRRLKMKTQVFVAHHGDHYRTRLTHTLEATQISRDIARSLGLNEDLTEAVTLAHDLGHTPFGHAGEETLDELLRPFSLSFEHNQQSRRIVEELEQVYPNFNGLNLTFEVRQGLMKHQTPWDQNNQEFQGASLEAQVVNLSDEIAYNNHDVDDGLRSGLITEDQLKDLAIWQAASELVEQMYGKIVDETIRKARTVSKMIGLMIKNLVETSASALENVSQSKEGLIRFSPELIDWNRELKTFLSDHFYFHPEVLKLSERGQKTIQYLFENYHSNPNYLPKEDQEAVSDGARLEVVIKDYIAGMTDEFAEQEKERITSLFYQ